MDIIYKAKGNYNKETIDKCSKYCIPDSFGRFAYTALVIILFAAVFFYIIKAYSFVKILLIGFVFIYIEYKIYCKKIIKNFIKTFQQLDPHINYDIYFLDNIVSNIDDPNENGIRLKYSDIKKIIETSDLYIIITKANLCLPIEANTLEPNNKYEWLDFLCERNIKIKCVNIS